MPLNVPSAPGVNAEEEAQTPFTVVDIIDGTTFTVLLPTASRSRSRSRAGRCGGSCCGAKSSASHDPTSSALFFFSQSHAAESCRHRCSLVADSRLPLRGSGILRLAFGGPEASSAARIGRKA